MKYAVAVALLLGLQMQAQVTSKVDLVGPKLPARGKHCEVQFFSMEPETPHQIIAHIRVYISRNKLLSRSESGVDSAKPEFQRQACRIGADAVVLVQQTTSNSNETQTLYVKGDAIHFKPAAFAVPRSRNNSAAWTSIAQLGNAKNLDWPPGNVWGFALISE